MRRYSAGAHFYDVLSGECLVYRAGRVAGIRMLDLHAGDTVFDLGCGTGLNFTPLVEAVGRTGLIVGLDRSADMLAVAKRRVERLGYENVRLVNADATAFDPIDIMRIAGGPVDAVFSSYALSVIGDWEPAWQRMRAVLRPGGRAAIVDMAVPSGAAAVFAPLARLVCAVGGADLAAHPWRALEEQGTEVQHVVLRGGHVHAVAARLEYST